MYEYSYTKSDNSSPIPIVRISLNNLRNNQIIYHDAILDTGSDVTLIPVSVVNKLNPPRIGRGQRKIINKPQGLGGVEIGIVPYRIKLGFSARELINVKIWSCLDDNLGGSIVQNLTGNIILGRNFLNRYQITFDGINSKLIVHCLDFLKSQINI